MAAAVIWGSAAVFLLGWCIVTIAVIEHLALWPAHYRSATRRGRVGRVAGVAVVLPLYFGLSLGLSSLLTYWWEGWM